MIKSFFFWIFAILYTLLIGSLITLVSFLDRSGRLIPPIYKLWGRLIVRFAGVKVTIENADRLDSSTPQILMSNHQSFFDVFALFGYLPVNLRFIAKKSLTRIPVFGQAMKAIGTIILDRENHQQAIKSLNQGAQKFSRGISILNFPEGIRSRNGKVGEFKKGGFVLAIKAKVPVTPLSVQGGGKILAPDSFRVHPGKMHIVVGEQFDVSKYSLEEKESLMKEVRSTIIRNLKED